MSVAGQITSKAKIINMSSDAVDITEVENEKRLAKTTAFLPIAYGSVAFYLGKKADEYQTHEWTLFLRGPNNEDLSGVISKVVFQLHASFAQPMREIETPPFSVTEKGWGEFEAQIKIFWKDLSEKPTMVRAYLRSFVVLLYRDICPLLSYIYIFESLFRLLQFPHGIKLYPPPPPNSPPGAPLSADVDTPVVAETYESITFTDPTELFYQQLLRVSSLSPVFLKEDRVQKALGIFSDESDFQALLEAKKFLENELSGVRERFQQVEGETSQVDKALRIMQEKARNRKSQRGGTAKKQKT